MARALISMVVQLNQDELDELRHDIEADNGIVLRNIAGVYGYIEDIKIVAASDEVPAAVRA